MKRLYLLRHAKSDWANPNLADIDRPLNERGIKISQRLGALFQDMSIHPDLILCSPARRTRQTLSFIQEGTGEDYPVKYDAGLYEGRASDIEAIIRAVPEDVDELMVIGHNPGLETLAHQLMAGGQSKPLLKLHEKFPTGGLAILSFSITTWADLVADTGSLIDFIVPRELA